MFKSPTNFEDETTTADKKNMTHENFSRNYGHNFQNAKNEENPSSTCLNKPIFRLIPKKLSPCSNSRKAKIYIYTGGPPLVRPPVVRISLQCGFRKFYIPLIVRK